MADWKHQAPKPKAPTTPAAQGTSRRSWQPGAAGPVKRKPTSKGTKFLFVGGFVGLLLAAVVVVILLWKPAKFPEVLIIASPNGSPAGLDNAPGGNVGQGFQDWLKAGTDRPKLAANPGDTSDRDAWKTKLDANAKMLVLYFAAPGGANASGPYLWFTPANATAPTDAQQLPVKEILDRLAALPAGQPKLVIFDLAQLHTSWAHGIYFPDFARALKELEPEIAKIENLAVICSCDTDQTAWSSDEWRRTVFGHFMLTGLAGAAGKSQGDRITGSMLFDYTKTEVTKWAAVNRDEKQEPILLPANNGAERAGKIELAIVPQTPAVALALHSPEKTPADLERHWDTAEKLSTRTPSPDTIDPARYREYLETLMRWEYQLRTGQSTEASSAKARVLSQQLAELDPATDPLCRVAGLSVGQGLGFPAITPNADAFRKLWSPPPGSRLSDEWTKQLAGQNETNFRLTIANHIVEELMKTGKAEDLKIADELLAVIDGSKVGTAETHFIRMLNRHLDGTNRPNELFIKNAIKARKEAEETAWLAGVAPGVHPYPEHVFRWIAKDIAIGDKNRRFAEDCLFDSAPESWSDSVKLYGDASIAYKQAAKTGKIVASALCARDEIFCRLPYYARWLANYRGKLVDEEIKKLLDVCENVARNAYQIADLTAEPTDDATKITLLDRLTVKIIQDFDQIQNALTNEIKSLTNTVHPSNWHAIHGALQVPFMPARDRIRLFGYLREISFALAPMTSQPTGTSPPAIPMVERAQRNTRIAQAILGDNAPDLTSMITNPAPGAWWNDLRKASERLGSGYRNLSTQAKEQTTKASTTQTLREAGKFLLKASQYARIADPAAPVQLTESPIVSERNYFRHYLMLDQSRRYIEDGWADVGPPLKPEFWYCKKAANLFTQSARPLVRGSDPNPTPQDLDRRFADVVIEEARQPVELKVDVAATKEVADERTWRFDYTVARQPGQIVGFPITWQKTADEPYHAKNPALNGRKRESTFAKSDSNSVKLGNTYTAVAQPGDVIKPGEMFTTVLYRGQLYGGKTEIVLAGNPTLDWHYTPPTGDAAFAVLVDAQAITGAVTILMDITASMNRPAGNPKYKEALKGVRNLLGKIPSGTTVTVVTFYGDKDKVNLITETLVSPFKFDGTEIDINKVMNLLSKIVPDGDNTPLAKAIEDALNPKSNTTYWPKKLNGDRTLIVITDGADNWKNDAPVAKIVIDAMRKTDDDVGVHITFFGVETKEEEDEAKRQFKGVDDPANFVKEKQRQHANLFFGVKDGEKLASNLIGAVLPRINYEDTKGKTDRFPVTLPGSAIISPSGLLKPGTYKLYGLGANQSLQLDPADRVLLKGRMQDDKLVLATFPLAFELAGSGDFAYIPKTTGPAVAGEALHLTLPELKLESPQKGYNLKFVVTMEPSGISNKERLQAPKPHFAWFDVTGGEPDRNGTLRIENYPTLNAPAWRVDLRNWESTKNARDKIRKPTVNGYWIDNYPSSVAKYSINMKSPDSAVDKAQKVVDQQGVSVTLVNASIEDWGDDTHPKGKYLTVSLSYSDPANKVFLRPTSLKGVDQKNKLHERHVYYDPLKRYTARFGPLEPEDLNGTEELVLYAVSSLRKQAGDKGRAATVTFPDREIGDYFMPSRLMKLVN